MIDGGEEPTKDVARELGRKLEEYVFWIPGGGYWVRAEQPVDHWL